MTNIKIDRLSQPSSAVIFLPNPPSLPTNTIFYDYLYDLYCLLNLFRRRVLSDVDGLPVVCTMSSPKVQCDVAARSTGLWHPHSFAHETISILPYIGSLRMIE